MKVLMIGLGSIGQRHLRNLRRLPGGESLDIAAYRVRGLSRTFSDDMRVREGVELEREFGLSVFHDLDEALAWGPDVAFVTNVTSAHVEVATRCAQAGCDLLVEKPLSDSMEGVDELLRIVRSLGLVVAMGFQNRLHPAARELRALLAAGALGDVMHAEAEYGERLSTMHSYEDYRDTYMARADLGGGAVMNLLVHDLDLLQWLLGRPTSVAALAGGASGMEVDVEDCASALISLAGASGRAVSAYAHVDFAQYPPTHRLKVLGTRGRVELDFIANTLRVCEGDEERVREWPGFERNDMFVEELEDFLDCVRERRQPEASLEQGVVSLAMALGIRESMQTGAPVELREDA